MSIGDVLAMVVSTRTDEPVLTVAGLLEDSHAASISVVLFEKAPEPSESMGAVYAGIWAAPPSLNGPRKPGNGELARLTRRLQKMSGRVPVKRIEVLDGSVADRAGLEARRVNLTIILQPSGARDEAFRRAMFESVLYESGRPVLLVPTRWVAETLGKTILIAWDGSREVTRAVADAEGLLAKSERVLVLEVDVGSREGLPAGEVVARLRRQGLQCHHRSVQGCRAEVDALLIREAQAIGADMIVMGGYGHPRLHEMLFGGVTRSMVRRSPLPLFISR